eukprot:1078175-Pelagomonas_calceolata.AAC.5
MGDPWGMWHGEVLAAMQNGRFREPLLKNPLHSVTSTRGVHQGYQGQEFTVDSSLPLPPLLPRNQLWCQGAVSLRLCQGAVALCKEQASPELECSAYLVDAGNSFIPGVRIREIGARAAARWPASMGAAARAGARQIRGKLWAAAARAGEDLVFAGMVTCERGGSTVSGGADEGSAHMSAVDGSQQHRSSQ